MCNDSENIAQDPIPLSDEGCYVSDSKTFIVFQHWYKRIIYPLKSLTQHPSLESSVGSCAITVTLLQMTP
jgi:hypothetical protein